MTKRIFLATAFFLSLWALVSCQNPTNVSPKTTGARTVSVNFHSNSARTVVADWTAGITSYDVKLTSHDAAPVVLSQSVTTAASALFTGVTSGTWDVSVDAYQNTVKVGGGTLLNQILDGSSSPTWNVVLTSALTQTATGTGGLSFTFAFPSSVGVNSVNCYLYDANGTWVSTDTWDTTTFTTSGSNSAVTYSKPGLASGAYTLQLDFIRNNSSIGLFVEGLNIWDGVTSDKWLDASGTLQSQRTFAATDFSSTDSLLGNLKVASAGGTNLPLTPAFSSQVLNYSLPTLEGSVSLAAFQSMGGQNLEWQQDGGAWTTMRSGTAVPSLAVPSTGTSIQIRVTANDRTTQSIYQLLIGGVVASPSRVSTTVGSTVQLSSASATGSGIAWSSADSSIASVDSAGLVTANRAGSTRVTAASGGYTSTTTVNVAVAGTVTTPSWTWSSTIGTLGSPTVAQGVLYVPDGGQIWYHDSNTTTVNQLNFPSGRSWGGPPIALASDGTNLFVSDAGQKSVQKIVIDKSTTPWSATATTVLTTTDAPMALVCDGTYLYVLTHTYNYAVVRLTVATNQAMTLVGPGSGFNCAVGALAIATDGVTLFTNNDYNIDTVPVTGSPVLTDWVGDYTPGNLDGLGRQASFAQPSSLTCLAGFLYVGDQTNQNIRKVDTATGLVTTVATDQPFTSITAITNDGTQLYVVDNNTIRVIQ